MSKHYKYPKWRTIVDGWWSRLFPIASEREFIRLMGWFWFWRYGFRHQGHVPPYRPDFVSYRHHLIIEIEGKSKYKSGDIVRDYEYGQFQDYRHATLLRKGWTVKYVWYEDFNPNSSKSNPLKTRRELRAWVRRQVWHKRIPFLKRIGL